MFVPFYFLRRALVRRDVMRVLRVWCHSQFGGELDVFVLVRRGAQLCRLRCWPLCVGVPRELPVAVAVVFRASLFDWLFLEVEQ